MNTNLNGETKEKSNLASYQALSPVERVFFPILLIFSFCFIHWYLAPPGVLDGILPDSDAYHRLYRVQRLLETGDWYDDRLPRYNAPYGDRSYWTRPMDVLIIMLQTLLRMWLSAESALLWAGIIVSPMLHIAMLMLYWKLTSGWMSLRSRWLSVLVYLWGDAICEQVVLGRADHHGLIHLANLSMLGGAIAIIRGDRREIKGFAAGSACLGLGAAFGLWVSMECQTMFFLVNTALLLLWCFKNIDSTKGLVAAKWLCMGLFLALLLERPLINWSEIQYDRLSIVHLCVAVITCIVWAIVSFVENRYQPSKFGRFAWLVATLVFAYSIMWAMLPRFFQGPLAEVGPQMRAIIPYFMDMRSLWPLSWETASFAVLLVGPFIAAFPLILCFLYAEWERLERPLMLFLVLPLPILAIALMIHMRMAVLIETFLPLAVAPALDWMIRRLQILRFSILRFPIVRAACICFYVFMLTLGPYVGAALAKVASQARFADCSPYKYDPAWVKLVCEDLNDISLVSSPTVVMAWLNYGPQIVYRTKHSVVGTPIHRNERGLADTVIVFGGTDDNVIRNVLRERHATLLLYLPYDSGVVLPGISDLLAESLAGRLNRGQVPSWLKPISLVRAASTPFQLYSVDAKP